MPENIDYDFIRNLEGGCKTTGYVPVSKKNKSGVTIATGFDLGQRNENDLKSLKLDATLITKFKPYLGVKGQDAEDLLKKSPLTISIAQAKSIDRKVKSTHITQLKIKYNSASGGKSSSICLRKLKRLLRRSRFNVGSI